MKTLNRAILSTLGAFTGVMAMATPGLAFGTLEADTASGVYGGSIQTYGSATIGSISAQVTRGINPTGTNGSLGAYSEFTEISNGVKTIDFNSGGTYLGDNNYVFGGNNDVVFNWSGGNTSIRSDRWAPSGAYGEVNTSDYLAVFRGSDVNISLNDNLNYIGLDWGALSSGNNFSFYNDEQLISTFTFEDINPQAPVRASQHGGEGNAYVHFYANEAQGVFNRIQITQATGGGFETDNYSFRYGEGEFDFETGQDVPFEIETTLGLLILTMGWLGHKSAKAKKLKAANAS